MGLTIEEVISILKYDNAMATFNPMTGEVTKLEDLDEDCRNLYKAHEYCINLLKNEPLKIEEISYGIVIWCKSINDWIKISAINKSNDNIIIAYNTFGNEWQSVIEYKDDIFYRKEVK